MICQSFSNLKKAMSQKPTSYNVVAYADDGVSQKSLVSLLSSFAEKIHQTGTQIASIKTISAAEIIGGGLANADCLIMPGGADLPYCQKLNGAGNQQILTFITNGGLYVGICAGGYYGANRIDFTGDGYHICGDRELSLFSGQAIGSIASLTGGRYYDESVATKSIAHLNFAASKNNAIESFYYHGGAYFSGAEDSEIVATYENGQVAAVAGACGLGKYLLTGVHFELCADVYKKHVFADEQSSQRLTPQEITKEKQLLELISEERYGLSFYRKIGCLLDDIHR